MRDMSESRRLAAVKWAAETRLRLDISKSERFAKLRDRLIIESVNDRQQDQAEKRGE